MKRHGRANVELRVGRHLPRYWNFVRVPVAARPRAGIPHGDLFAYVDDDYVICDPETYQIVAIRHLAARPTPALKIAACASLDEDEREVIIPRHPSKSGWTCTTSNAAARDHSERIQYRRVDACRYFVAEDEIAIVDPEEEKVVLLIDRS